MKKNYFRNLLFIVLSLVFVVLGCKVDSSVANSELPMDKLDVDDFTTSFGKALCLTMEATRDMASYLVDEGVVSIPTTQVKSSAIKNTDFCDILNNYYNSRKSINADLDGKMDEIADRYNSRLYEKNSSCI